MSYLLWGSDGVKLLSVAEEDVEVVQLIIQTPPLLPHLPQSVLCVRYKFHFLFNLKTRNWLSKCHGQSCQLWYIYV